MVLPKTFTYIYVAICSLSLASMSSWPMAYMVLKPLIVASLLVYYIISLQKQHSLIILGLVFAIIGDVLLLFENDTIFKLGIGAFLIMQVSYILYLKQFQEKAINIIQKSLITGILLLGLSFLVLSYEKIGADFKYIIVYTMALTFMGVIAIKFPRLNKKLSIIGIGAILFILSDLTLAINKYIYPNGLLNYVVMILYMIGQYLIIIGITHDAKDYFNKVATNSIKNNKN